MRRHHEHVAHEQDDHNLESLTLFGLKNARAGVGRVEEHTRVHELEQHSRTVEYVEGGVDEGVRVHFVAEVLRHRPASIRDDQNDED